MKIGIELNICIYTKQNSLQIINAEGYLSSEIHIKYVSLTPCNVKWDTDN